MHIPLSDDKHQMVRDSSKKCAGQRGLNSNPVATLPHAAVVFRIQPFNFIVVYKVNLRVIVYVSFSLCFVKYEKYFDNLVSSI